MTRRDLVARLYSLGWRDPDNENRFLHPDEPMMVVYLVGTADNAGISISWDGDEVYEYNESVEHPIEQLFDESGPQYRSGNKRLIEEDD